MLTLKVASMLLLASFCLHAALALPLPNHDDIIVSRGTDAAKPPSTTDNLTKQLQEARLVAARDAVEAVPMLHKRIEVQRSAPALLALGQVGVRVDATSLRQAAVVDKRIDTSRTTVNDMQASSKAGELKPRYEFYPDMVRCDSSWCFRPDKFGRGTTWNKVQRHSDPSKKRPELP